MYASRALPDPFRRWLVLLCDEHTMQQKACLKTSALPAADVYLSGHMHGPAIAVTFTKGLHRQ
jgi:hypothetical protein